jgi:SAM-dependent methyltransferase
MKRGSFTALDEWIPPQVCATLARNGYARLDDLDDPEYGEIVCKMESFQAAFLARTRALWDANFPIPADALWHFGRQWEYPYAWTNAAGPPGRLLDAGSGITFLPFLFAVAGFEVHCCDNDAGLDLETRFEQAAHALGAAVSFTSCSLTDMAFDGASFDTVACISVLEHTGPARGEIIAALARVLKPGGRLIVTCDVDLGRDDELRLEDVAVVLAEVERHFEFAHPLDLRRTRDLLTSDRFLASAPWRLPVPWRPPAAASEPSDDPFRSVAILGVTAVKRAAPGIV